MKTDMVAFMVTKTIVELSPLLGYGCMFSPECRSMNFSPRTHPLIGNDSLRRLWRNLCGRR